MKRVRSLASASGVCFVILLGACAVPAASPTLAPSTQAPVAPSATPTREPVPPTPTPTVVAALAEITFDGQSCQYEGPEAIAEGQLVIVLNNPTRHEHLHLHVGKFGEGKTWEDLVEFMGGLTTERPPPPWLGLTLPSSVDGDTDFSSRLQERYFREWGYSLDPGSYGIVCAAHGGDPRGIWLAGPLEVSAKS